MVLAEMFIAVALEPAARLAEVAPRMVTSPPLVSIRLERMNTPVPLLTLVLANEPLGSMAPLMVRSPPLVRMVALFNATEPLPLLLKFDSSDTFSVAPSAWVMLVPVMLTLRWAISVRLALPCAWTLSSTLMSPEVPGPDEVCTMMLAPSLSDALSVAELRVELPPALGVNGLSLEVPELAPLVILMLYGSSSQVPPLPEAALRLTRPVASRAWAEVSTNPPLPPSPPPITLILPWN